MPMKKLILAITILLFSGNLFAQCGNFSQNSANFFISNTNAGNTGVHSYRFILNTQIPIAAGQMLSNGADIRVGQSCCSLYDFWIDSTTLNTANTIIWVRLPNIPPLGSLNFKVFYGGGNISSMSNLAATFPSRYVLNSGIDSLTGPKFYDWFEVKAGATLYVKQWINLEVYADKIVIKGNINGVGKGYAGYKNFSCATGPGPGGGLVGTPCNNGGGGSYGGNAGCTPGAGATSCNRTGALAYGTNNGFDIQPGSSGSTGTTGNSGNDGAGNGGGAIMLYAKDIIVNGIINMNATDGQCASDAGSAGGGGAGGGILIFGAYLNLQGATLSANGGKAGNKYAATGSGGRIKIFRKISLTGTYTFSVNSTNQHTWVGTVLLASAVGSNGTFFSDSINTSSITTNFFIPTFTGNSSLICGTAYYSKPSGNLNDTATWGSNTNGTGISPSNFNGNNTYYFVHNQSNSTINAAWSIGGTNSVLVLGNGIQACSLNIPAGLNIAADSVYTHANTTLKLRGNLVSNKQGYHLNSLVQFEDSLTQNIAAFIYGNVACTNSNKQLTGNVQIMGNLNMNSDIYGNNYSITIGSSAAQAGSLTRTAGNIYGNLRRWIPSTLISGSAGLFPIGSGGNYLPLQLDYTTAPTIGGMVSLSFVQGNPGNLGLPITDTWLTPAISINKVGTNGIWRVEVLSGLTGGIHNITATGNNFWGISSLNQLRLVKRNNTSSAWLLAGNSVAGTGTIAGPIAKRTGLNSLAGEFAFSSDSTTNILPITLLNFTGEINNAEVNLHWTSASEINSDYFSVEQMKEEDWQQIGKVKAQGNFNQMSHYSFIDPILFEPKEARTYRLKMVDRDLKYAYSNLITLSNSTDRLETMLYPNPASSILNIYLPNAEAGESIEIVLSDEFGRIIIENKLQLNADKLLQIKTSNLAAGIYFIIIKTAAGIGVHRFVKD